RCGVTARPERRRERKPPAPALAPAPFVPGVDRGLLVLDLPVARVRHRGQPDRNPSPRRPAGARDLRDLALLRPGLPDPRGPAAPSSLPAAPRTARSGAALAAVGGARRTGRRRAGAGGRVRIVRRRAAELIPLLALLGATALAGKEDRHRPAEAREQ